MMIFPPEINDGIKRYLWDIAAHLGHLTSDERLKILQTVEAHLAETLHARYGEAPTIADLQAVLAEMPRPESYAGKTPDTHTNAGNLSETAPRWNWPFILGIASIIVAAVLLFRGVMTLIILPLLSFFPIPLNSWPITDFLGIMSIWAFFIALLYLVAGTLLWMLGMALMRQPDGEHDWTSAVNDVTNHIRQSISGTHGQVLIGVASVTLAFFALLRGVFSLYLVNHYDRYASLIQQSLEQQIPQFAQQSSLASILHMGTAGLTFWGWFWIVIGLVLAGVGTKIGTIATRLIGDDSSEEIIWRKLARFAKLCYPTIAISLALELFIFVVFNVIFRAIFPQTEFTGVEYLFLLLLATPITIFLCERIILREFTHETSSAVKTNSSYAVIVITIALGFCLLIFSRNLPIFIAYCALVGLLSLLLRVRHSTHADQLPNTGEER